MSTRFRGDNHAHTSPAGQPRDVFRAAWLAWTLFALLIAGALWGQMLAVAVPGPAHDVWALANAALNAVYIAAFGVVGVLIVLVGRQRRNAIGWLLLVIAVSLEFIAIVQGYWELTRTTPLAPTPGNLFFLWLGGWDWWLLIGPLLLILLLFPTGRLLSWRWRGLVIALAACFAIFLFVATFGPNLTDLNTGQGLPNPLRLLSEVGQNAVLVPVEVLLLLTVAGGGSAIFVRYRRAAAIEREQIKWFLSACALFVIVYVTGFFWSDNKGWGILFDLAILAVPVSIGIAILRYHLWDIDLIIRRTLIYAVLTGLLALVYFGSVVVLQNLLGVLTGQRQSALVTVLSTLVIAALFVPLRGRVQALIDQRFYRRKYDAARALAAFALSARDDVDLDELTAGLVEVVDETMQPASVGLWLRAPERRRP